MARCGALGVSYYRAAPRSYLKDSLAPTLKIRDEQGAEISHNFAVTGWLTLGADRQIIDPSLASETAVFAGLRTVVRS
jgi:hypothetical protein